MLLRILTFFKWVYGNPLTFLVGIRRIPAYHVDYTTACSRWFTHINTNGRLCNVQFGGISPAFLNKTANQQLVKLIIICYIYIAHLWVLKALYIEGGELSSSTTNVQHPPGCDDSHIAPEPHTSLLVERWQSDEANQWMGIIRRPWWSKASGWIWPRHRGYTSTLFRRTSWDF